MGSAKTVLHGAGGVQVMKMGDSGSAESESGARGSAEREWMRGSACGALMAGAVSKWRDPRHWLQGARGRGVVISETQRWIIQVPTEQMLPGEQAAAEHKAQRTWGTHAQQTV